MNLSSHIFEDLAWVSTCFWLDALKQLVIWVLGDEFLRHDRFIQILREVFKIRKYTLIQVCLYSDTLFWLWTTSHFNFFSCQRSNLLVPFHNLLMLRRHSNLPYWSVQLLFYINPLRAFIICPNVLWNNRWRIHSFKVFELFHFLTKLSEIIQIFLKWNEPSRL